MSNPIVFRAACQPSMGTGHLHRCLTLTTGLLDRGISATIVTDDTPLARVLLSRFQGDVIYVSPTTFLPCGFNGFDVLVMDVPPGSGGFLETPDHLGRLSDLNDDGVAIVSLGHVSKNALFFRAVIDLYPNQRIHAANYIEGYDYLILRKEFADPPDDSKSKNGGLISMGGSDPMDLTLTGLLALAEGGFNGKAKVVLGPGYTIEKERQLLKSIRQYDMQVEILRNISDMRSLMRHACFGMTAFGTTAYEMMSQGLPVMAFTHYRWQESSARLFESLNCCKYLGCAENPPDSSVLGKEIKTLLSDDHKLRVMAEKGRSIVDGKGAERVVDLLVKLAAGKNNQKLDVLFVLAHPGDELFGCGGTLLKHLRAGDHVGVVILGEGVSSRCKDADGKAVIVDARRQIRASLQSVMDKLGLTEWYYYNFEDNRFDKHNLLDLIKVVETIISRHRPHTLYTHHPGDLNIDHRLALEAVVTAARPTHIQSVQRIFSIEVPSSTDWGGMLSKSNFVPNWFVDISDVLDEKLELLQQYVTELRDDPHPRSINGIQERARQWGRHTGRRAAEAFVLQRAISV